MKKKNLVNEAVDNQVLSVIRQLFGPVASTLVDSTEAFAKGHDKGRHNRMIDNSLRRLKSAGKIYFDPVRKGWYEKEQPPTVEETTPDSAPTPTPKVQS